MKRLILIGLTGLMLTGCASAKMLYREMPEDTSESAIILKGKPLRKKPIIGKGWEAEVRGQIEAKVTNKDGTIVEIKTMKSSFLEKMMGWMYLFKPNNVGLGGK